MTSRVGSPACLSPPDANWRALGSTRTAQISRTASRTIAQTLSAEHLHGKEGVDGSSPSEGSAKAPHVALFLSDQLADHPTWCRSGALYGAFRIKRSSETAKSARLTPRKYAASAESRRQRRVRPWPPRLPVRGTAGSDRSARRSLAASRRSRPADPTGGR